MKAFVSVLIVFVLLALPLGQINVWASNESAPAAYSGYPTFSITNVKKDVSVTIKTSNLPPNDEFKVRMGKKGTKAVDGIVVGSIDSGSGGTKSFSFEIPADLKGLKQIAIRFDSKTGSGYYAYNWFWNNTSSGGGTSTGGYSGYPTFSITAVVRNSSVTIQTKNLPKNDTFAARMNTMGTKGTGGIKVATFSSGEGGTRTYTFSIPEELKGLKQIAIRFDSTAGSGYYAYNWFYNTTTK